VKEYLELRDAHLVPVSNGTVALQIAMRALDIRGEVITTPFSYVATSSSIVWEHCRPVFTDINPIDFNLDPNCIESAITEHTTAILGTHVFGLPCDHAAISKIADKHGLRIIYDAAHCFGVKINGDSVFGLGDVSATSFHATKIFHTVEGGAVISNSSEIAERSEYMRNFGHDGPWKFNGVGINGKMSEFHAAMGLVNLAYMDDIIADRKRVYEEYRSALDQDRYQIMQVPKQVEHNYSYFPVLFPNEQELISAQNTLLQKHSIQTRRYFYPLLSDLDYMESKSEHLRVAKDISSRILCLPTYFGLESEHINTVCTILNR
jgi:dTDP-4-amino-4,6-dideoxygalactose transaminase